MKRFLGFFDAQVRTMVFWFGALACGLTGSGCEKLLSRHLYFGEVEVDTLRVDAVQRGKLAQVLVKPGQWVKKGDALAVIEDPELRIKLHASEAQIQSLQNLQNVSIARVPDVGKNAANSTVDLLAQARESFSQIKRQQAELVIRAPSDGEVTRILAHEGQWVNPGTPVTRIVRLTEPWIATTVPEQELHLFAIGRRVQVDMPGLKDFSAVGKVTFISPIPHYSPQIGQRGRDRQEKVFDLRIRLEKRVPGMRPGMTAVIRELAL